MKNMSKRGKEKAVMRNTRDLKPYPRTHTHTYTLYDYYMCSGNKAKRGVLLFFFLDRMRSLVSAVLSNSALIR
jgi:hypothetical protein